MARINNKVELLRALETTVEQFDALIEKNCKGELQDPVIVVTPKTSGGGVAGGVNRSVEPTVQGQTFSKEDKEFLEEFKQLYQRGIFQLQDFIKKLMTASQMLDQYTLEYYIRQLKNGPYAKFVKEFSKYQGIFQAIPDCLGIIGTVSRSNSSTPVFDGVAAAVNINILDKSPSFIQREMNSIVRTTTEVFNHNFQSSIFGDNTLPYIDKRPRARALLEGRTGPAAVSYASTAVANYMLKDVKSFNVITGVAQRILDLIKAFLGSDAFRLLQFKKDANPFSAEQNVSSTSNDSIPRLLMSTVQVTSETGDRELKESCIEVQTGLTGNVVVNNVPVNDVSLSLNQSLDGSPLYTVEGRLGSRGGEPDDTVVPPPPPTTVPGCMDPNAKNFNPDATEDDGSCEYVTEEEILCPEECDNTNLQY